MSAAVADRTENLTVLSFEGARKLHVADPTDQMRPLCGREGDAEVLAGEWRRIDSRSVCKGCLEEVAALITVKVPDPDTGEVVERLVRRFHFRPEPDLLPLPDSFKEQVLAGDRPTLKWSGYEDPPVEVGQLVQLTNQVFITISGLTRTRKGDHIAHYAVDDDRPALPRRTPPMHQPPEFDHLSLPIPHTKESIAAATIDGNYTQDPKQAVTGVAPEVDVEYRRVLGVRRRMKQISNESTEEVRRKRERAIRDRLREVLKGLDPENQVLLLAKIEQDIANAVDPSAEAA